MHTAQHPVVVRHTNYNKKMSDIRRPNAHKLVKKNLQKNCLKYMYYKSLVHWKQNVKKYGGLKLV